MNYFCVKIAHTARLSLTPQRTTSGASKSGIPPGVTEGAPALGASGKPPMSALTTAKLDQSNIKKIVAISTILIGSFTLMWVILV